MNSELDFFIVLTGQLFVLCFIGIVGYGFILGLEKALQAIDRFKRNRMMRLPAAKVRFYR